MRRQPGCPLHARNIAGYGVARRCISKKLRDAFLCAAFPRFPGRTDAAGPVDLRLQFQRLERKRFRPFFWRGDAFRRRQRFIGIGFGEAVPPIGSEDLERFARLILNRPRLVQKCAAKAFRPQPGASECFFGFRVAGDCSRLIPAVPKHRFRACFLREREQRLGRRATADDEARAHCFERSRERRERLMQPPPSRATGNPRRVRLWVPNENRNHRARTDRTSERRIIRKPKIEAKPQDATSHSFTASPPAAACNPKRGKSCGPSARWRRR